jgi:D-3-phosphoglycerate dehydrogenase
MTFKAVRLNAVTYPVEPEERAEMARAGAEFVEVEGQTPDEILAAAKDCDALLVVSSSVPKAVVEGLSRCRVIARLGAGTDKIDVAGATERGILVTNVPDFCLTEQADHTFALLLAFARRLPFMMDAMRTNDWSARHHPGVHRLTGQTLGLIGFGSSAQAVARRATAFGLRLQAWVRARVKYSGVAEQLGTKLVPLDQLLSESDFVSIHLPLTPDTYHLISAERLAKLKPTAVLINTARGAIVDEAALVKLLQQRKIGGAALDVFEGIDVFAIPGTPASHPLLNLDNVILTPHCAGSSVESSRESKVRGARNAADILLGIEPKHIVNRHPGSDVQNSKLAADGPPNGKSPGRQF